MYIKPPKFVRRIFPSLMLSAALYCFNYIGDGLRDALDPKDR